MLSISGRTMIHTASRARVEVVPGAGHAVQSGQPLALARLIYDFIF